jgi:predicted amidophosphoribosyltransferase
VSKGVTAAAASAPTGVSLSPPELCPLCGAPLKLEQDWCLRCGTGARTRLAAQPKWKALVLALALVVVVSLGVLAAALVKLAG